jgi:hypothetical protein
MQMHCSMWFLRSGLRVLEGYKLSNFVITTSVSLFNLSLCSWCSKVLSKARGLATHNVHVNLQYHNHGNKYSKQDYKY